ncbi:AraC family transcriptional regulator [Parabacteroides sp. 52]|uniref:helix-turn-helix domain-containing protein n=1 Tax=unclassified Parabacteroides TaxID=2649774 RepID=UPI0013D7843A|nr:MULTISPECIES: AraC family transcriptional regulator [unclassified Parabacteroides]MDH6534878.1 AraC-like DNA-binding protein [Parabacteroides sp. PM5-20]NDV55595.1 AraC family transcriptional regulator [Parabacteroides sp. 52]
MNITEHVVCGNYEKGNSPLIETITFKKGETLKRNIVESEMLFVRNGSFHISYQKVSRQFVYKGQIMLLPPACHFYIEVEEDASIMVFRINSSIQLCNSFAIENLFKQGEETKDEISLLEVNERLDYFLNLLSHCIKDGLKCTYYYKLKIQELMYYLRVYYSKEELKGFFSSVLTKDSVFANFVYKNYAKVKTVQQFSDLYGYSQSSFDKQFKKVFGISAYQWMIDQKSKQIYHKLICSDNSLAEIAFEYDFSSLSQFSDFCKHYLGDPPGRIRRRKGR